MAVRRVEIRLATTGFEEAKRELDEIKAKADELDAKRPTVRVKLDLVGDMSKLDALSVKLDEIGAKTARPNIEIAGLASTIADLTALTVTLDALGGKKVRIGTSARGGVLGTIEKDIARTESAAGGGGGGGAMSGILSMLAGANNAYAGVGIASVASIAASIIPAIIPAALGGLVGGGATFGALALGTKAHTQLLALRQQLAGITGNTPADQARKASIEHQIATLHAQKGPFLGAYGALAGLGHTAEHVFGQALTSNASRPHGGTVPGSSFLAGLTGILKQIGGFVKSIGPELGQMFRASLPFLKMFVNIMEQFAKAVLPAVTQSLNQMKPYIPQLMQGFTALAQGVADFIKDLGPGMGNAVVVFKALMIGVKGILIALSYTFDGVAWSVRHLARWSAVAWDAIVNNVKGAWRFIDKTIPDGVNNVIKWFGHLDREAVAKLKSLPSDLGTVGTDAMMGLWNGLKSMGGKVLGWVGSFVKSIPGTFMKLLQINSPSRVMHDIGMGVGEGLAQGMNASAKLVNTAASNLTSALVSTVKKGTAHLHGEEAGKHGEIVPKGYASGVRTNALQGVTLATLASNGVNTPAGFATGLRSYVVLLREFRANILKLARRGLAGPLLDQIVQAGPDQGNQIALELLQGPMSDIRLLNNYERQIEREARSLGHVSAYAVYDRDELHPHRHHRRHHAPSLALSSPGMPSAAAMAGAGGGQLSLVVSAGGGMNSELAAAILRMLRFEVRTKGGGNVQKVLGRA